MSARFDVVVPTVGRPSLGRLLAALAASRGPAPGQVYVVDDRPRCDGPLPGFPWAGAFGVTVLRGRAAGPAAARNVGWRAAEAEWVAFLDDDVVPDADWCERLVEDVASASPNVGGSQGNIKVPVPTTRRPMDWERNVRGLETARWATADMAYRSYTLREVGGFDERFTRAYREDADLGLRVVRAGYRIEQGSRGVTHPVRPADPWVSVRLQAGNADDALMRALHGPGWREAAGVPQGRRNRHLAISAAGVLAITAALAGRRGLAGTAALAWLAGTMELSWTRIAAGPRTRDEVLTMVATSALIPAAATLHWLRGWASVPRLTRRRAAPPRAVLLDRDGTLVLDVPYNGDPADVVPIPGARQALDRLRAAGVGLAVVSNQSGVARGLLTAAQVEAVNARVEALLGPIEHWFYCPHAPGDRCGCRKPAPGLVVRAAGALGVAPADCALIGDTGADVGAALAAGARPVLVPTAITRHEEVAAAPEVAADLGAAVDLLLGGRP
jgi:histidinol-phosphate phosphatase family protein